MLVMPHVVSKRKMRCKTVQGMAMLTACDILITAIRAAAGFGFLCINCNAENACVAVFKID